LLRLACSLAVCLLASGSAGGAPDVQEGELILKLRAGASPARGAALAGGHGAEVIDSLSELKMHRLRVPEAARESVQAALSRRAEVEWVEPNALLEPVAVPDDPRFEDAWHLGALGAPSAWDLSTGAGVTLAILDSGVDPNHPDLEGKLVPGYNFYDGNSDTRDVFGHGTRVAGAAAADTNNGIGVASIGWGAQLMPIRVTSTSGYASAWAIAQGLAYAVDHGARVMNLSFAGVGGSSTVANAAAYAVQNGGVVVAAAGNCGCTESTPDRAELLTVGAMAQGDVIWSGSSRGDHVDFSAPGAAILSTVAGGGYGAGTGTSFSAPVAAGVVALLLAADPTLDAAEVEALLAASAVDLGGVGWDPAYGHGRLDAAAAVQAISTSPPPPSDGTPPSVAITTPETGAIVRREWRRRCRAPRGRLAARPGRRPPVLLQLGHARRGRRRARARSRGPRRRGQRGDVGSARGPGRQRRRGRVTSHGRDHVADRRQHGFEDRPDPGHGAGRRAGLPGGAEPGRGSLRLPELRQRELCAELLLEQPQGGRGQSRPSGPCRRHLGAGRHERSGRRGRPSQRPRRWRGQGVQGQGPVQAVGADLADDRLPPGRRRGGVAAPSRTPLPMGCRRPGSREWPQWGKGFPRSGKPFPRSGLPAYLRLGLRLKKSL
jgi:hypothetical protein